MCTDGLSSLGSTYVGLIVVPDLSSVYVWQDLSLDDFDEKELNELDEDVHGMLGCVVEVALSTEQSSTPPVADDPNAKLIIELQLLQRELQRKKKSDPLLLVCTPFKSSCASSCSLASRAGPSPER